MKIQRKKRLVPLVAMCLSVIMVMGIMAGAVDTAKTDCSLTVTVCGGTNVDGTVTPDYPELMQASVSAHLYRVAAITADYQYVDNATGFESLKLEGLKDIGRQGANLNQQEYTEGWNQIAQQAAELVEQNKIAATQDLTITGTGTFSSLSTGLYLLTVDDAYIGDHIYRWSPYLVSVPSMNALDGTDMYDVSTALKPAQFDRTGNLVIQKTLNSYATMTGQATAVFHITGTKEGYPTYSNVVSLTFDSTGTKTTTIEGLPVGMQMTVEEVQYGGAYEQSAIEPSDGRVTIVPLDTGEAQATVSFTNDYNHTPVYSTSVSNHFEPTISTDENGETKVNWDDGWSQLDDNSDKQ